MTQTSPLAAPALDDLASLRASYRQRKQALLTELGDSGNRMRGMNHVLGQLARLTDEVKPGILSTTFHFPDVMVNNITSDIHDSEALCPEYKVVAVRIRKSKGKFKQLAEQAAAQ